MPNPARAAKSWLRRLVGSAEAYRSRRESRDQALHPQKGIGHFLDLAGKDGAPPAEAPIFIFSAGWRSGSTLLQRLVCSAERVLIWGEPYDRSCPVRHLAESLAPFSASWPQPSYYRQPDPGDVSQRWIANLYPPPAAILAGYRALMMESFARPARALGATRWGLKEVRFGLPEAVLLKGLFPDARFLFIRRPLADAYLSYRSFSQRTDWYAAWPGGMAATAYSFARHWARMTAEFDAAAGHTGGLMIDYDALVSGAFDLSRLEQHAGITIDRDVLKTRVGQGGGRARATLTPVERLQLAAGRRAGRRRARI